MPTPAEQLKTIRDQLLANLVAMTATPKLTYSIDGQSLNYQEYQQFILSQLESINLALQQYEPYEEHSQIL